MLIDFVSRDVKAKGINKDNILNYNAIKKYIFPEEYGNIKLIEKIPKQNIDNPVLFYPGCGTDIITPLIYIDKILESKTCHFIFNDKDNMLPILKTILDTIEISFEEDNNQITFFVNKKLITLQFIQCDIFKTEIPRHNIYFEKAFRIMKSYHDDYEQRVIEKNSGIIITDSGFYNQDTIKVSKELSAYKEMKIIKNFKATSL